MGNLLRGFLVRQSFIVPEDLIPFETSPTHELQTLSTFRKKTLTVIINGYEFQLSTDYLTAEDRKDRKAEYIILHDIDSLLRTVKNFAFTVAYILRDDSFAKL